MNVPDNCRPIGREISGKIDDEHRNRLAIVYVRQSTPQQVVEHPESLARQYAFADYAHALGWHRDRILVIDEDLGKSGKTAEGRAGFQRLLAEVMLDHVGLVLGLEMSRLARSSKDWHHLFEVCGVFGSLLADEDGVYNSNDPNDRLLLGLKGIINELELHTMRNRLDGGKLSKAKRGELYLHAPTGYVKASREELVLDPDEQARAAVQMVFDKFVELGTAHAVFRYFRQHNIRMGIRPIDGPRPGELEWRPLGIGLVYSMLRNPTYSGTYTYGRHPVDVKKNHGKAKPTSYRVAPMSEWKALIHDHFPAYITWDQYLRNRERLLQNATRGDTRGHARHGSALMSGLLVCGRCGQRLRVSYKYPEKPRYDCNNNVRLGKPPECFGLNGNALDAALTQHVLEALTPTSIELSMQAAQDLGVERERLHTNWRRELERAGYESQRAERAYRAVDPENRLVARTLEQQWETALRQQQEVQENYTRFQADTPRGLTREEQDRIRALSTDIPALWNSPDTSVAVRKEIVRCLIEHVVVNVRGNSEIVDVTIYWVGGAESEHSFRRPVQRYEQLADYPEMRQRIMAWRQEGCTTAEIADRLNEAGFYPPSTRAEQFNDRLIGQLMYRLGLGRYRPRPNKLQANEWWLRNLAEELGIPLSRLRHWTKDGYVHSRKIEGYFVIWADQDELDRLAQMRDHPKDVGRGFPRALKTPKPRPAQ